MDACFGESFAVPRGHDVIGLPAGCRPEVAVARLVAFQDAAGLPELEVIEKLTARDPNFAYEQLIEVIGG